VSGSTNREDVYVGRIRACGCAVFACAVEPNLADSAAEALYGGLLLERMTIEDFRGRDFKFGGCDHPREPARPGGFGLWGVESWCVVAAADEDGALAIEVDDHGQSYRRAIPVDPATLRGDEIVFSEDNEWDPPTLRQWLVSEPSDEERARMNRATLEEQGQRRLAL
jgi:hypothetical protein